MSIEKKATPLWYYLTILFPIAGGIIAFFFVRKTDSSKAKKCLIFNLIIWGIIISFIVYSAVYLGTENPFYVVTSQSMMPNLQVFDLVVIQANYPFENIKTGDIILFNKPVEHDTVIVHRVTEILNKDPLTIRTKGDANSMSIQGIDFPITKDDYIGKVVSVLPQIGYTSKIISFPINTEIMIVILGLAYFHHYHYRHELNKPKQPN